MLKFISMITLVEIKAAADSLSAEQKQELLLFLAARLRGAGQLPPHESSRRLPLVPATGRSILQEEMDDALDSDDLLLDAVMRGHGPAGASFRNAEEMAALLLSAGPATPMTAERKARIYGKLKRRPGRRHRRRMKI
jgi:hypothetical protein